jgi:hypothetical protein
MTAVGMASPRAPGESDSDAIIRKQRAAFGPLDLRLAEEDYRCLLSFARGDLRMLHRVKVEAQ